MGGGECGNERIRPGLLLVIYSHSLKPVINLFLLPRPSPFSLSSICDVGTRQCSLPTTRNRSITSRVLYTDPRVQIDSTWSPCGVHLEFIWSPSGVHLESLPFNLEYFRSPHGVHVESSGLHINKWSLSRHHFKSIWSPSGVDLESIWSSSGVHLESPFYLNN